MSRSEQSYICSRPFQWCEVHPDGSVFLCCPAWLKRPIGNLLQQPIEQIWNGAVAQEIRKSILNGSFHNCSSKRCPYLQEKNWPVQTLATLADDQVGRALSAGSASLDFLPTQLNLCFDHSCNLACPSCRDELQQASGAALEQAEQIATIIHQELLPGAEIVTLSGFGDPFGSPTYRRLLLQLKRCDFPQLRQIHLHSNGQRLTPQMWASLPELQSLVAEIEISIDAATAATYQTNRRGGDFARLLENLEFLSQQPCRLILSLVVQQNNWREIPQLLKLADRFAAKVYLSQLVNWGTFSKQEFRQRAVHLPQHPEHEACRQLLRVLTDTDRIDFGNLRRWLDNKPAAIHD